MSEHFDPEAKERLLKEESEAWDTTAVSEALPGDIPVVDVGPYFKSGLQTDLEAAASDLHDSSVRVGFYQLVGHDLDPGLCNQILEATRQFHALPREAKSAILMDRPGWPVGGVGYLQVGARKLPRRDKGNRNAAFLIKSDEHLSFEDNQWPIESDLPGFRAVVESYASAITSLAIRLLPVYAVALELEPDFFAPAFRHPFWRLRMTHYPPVPPRRESDPYGIAPHVDTTFFTLLLPDGPGLNIFSHLRQQWIQAPVVPGAFVVNSGELLKQWTNDRFLSTRHFADNQPDNDRYSVPYFFNASSDYPMECLPSCWDESNPPKYPTISYSESQAAVQGE